VQIAKLFVVKAFINTNFAKQMPGFEPIVFSWRQDWMVASKSLDELLLGRLSGSSAEFREDHSRVSDQTQSVCDSLLMAAGTEMVDEDRSVEDNKITHRVPKIQASRHISTSAS